MGLMSPEQAKQRQGRMIYLSYDKSLGMCTKEKSDGKLVTVGAIEGYLMGIGSHVFESDEGPTTKFSIFIRNNEDQSELFQLQNGFYTWNTWGILNKLLSVIDKIAKGEHIVVSCSKRKERKGHDFFIELSGRQLKQKFSSKTDNDKLKFKPMEEADANKIIRNKHIDAWFDKISEILPNTKELAQEYVAKEPPLHFDDDEPAMMENNDIPAEAWDDVPY